jgi:hypothetical protein
MKETSHEMEKEVANALHLILHALPKQSERLLSAFLRADGYYLSHCKISQVCRWKHSDVGIGDKRRQAVKQLRTDAKALGCHLCFEVRRGKGYRLAIENCLYDEEIKISRFSHDFLTLEIW